MSPTSPFGSASRRLAAYGYLAPLLEGRRILELGSADGAGSAHLFDLGAAAVLGVDADEARVGRARREHVMDGVTFARLDPAALGRAGGFDLIVVPEAETVIGSGARVTPATLREWLRPEGRMVLLAQSGDHSRGAGFGYYEVVEALEPLFPAIRMFGLTPFAAFGLAEFSENPAGLRIEGGLVDEAAEQPTHYLAVAGPEDTERVDLGYALVQVPATGGGENGASVSPEEESDLRRRLAESEGKLEGLVRVSRAQTEEIEELRGRLRRGGEARAELDQEVGRLRTALAEADRSVVDLTRRTTEEMAALAQRIAGGLAPGAHRPAGGAAGPDFFREELAARESALSDRDDRIAALEGEKQDLLWRLEEAEARAGEAPSAPVSFAGSDAAAELVFLQEELRLRDQALDQYRQAAIVHVAEVNRLREALGEQGTLVSELEEARLSDRRQTETLEGENTWLRRQLAEAEEADRTRRSRLAEVEGTLLRLQRQAAIEAANGAGGHGDGGAERQVAALEVELGTQRRRLAEAQEKYALAEQKAQGLERALEESRLGLLAAQAAAAAAPVAPESMPAEATATGGAEPAANEGDLYRLREALERSEEQLWEAKGQLLLDRERIAVLESQIAGQAAEADTKTISESVHLAIVQSVLQELAELEVELRAEVERLSELEQKVEAWRADLAVTDTEVGVSLPRAE